MKTHIFDTPFVTESGASIAKPQVAYRTWGQLNENADNAVIIFHALTGNTEADKWFAGFWGAGKAIDPQKHFIICANALGSCYGTSGPTSTNPETGQAYQADFPKVTVRDMARLHQRLLDALGIQQLELAIGGSLGGMQALEFCIMDDRPKAAALLAMGKAHTPWAIGISHTQRQAIFNDPLWNDGFYAADTPPINGLATARMIAMNSYRSPRDFQEKFGRKKQDDSTQFQIESYLNYQGKKLADRFDANAYVRLTHAMDTHDIARNRGDYADVLGALQLPVLVVGIDSDQLYPPVEQQELARFLPAGVYHELKTPYGHDAFLIEFEQMNAIFSTFLTHLKKAEAV